MQDDDPDRRQAGLRRHVTHLRGWQDAHGQRHAGRGEGTGHADLREKAAPRRCRRRPAYFLKRTLLSMLFGSAASIFSSPPSKLTLHVSASLSLVVAFVSRTVSG